jgi:hypothetical protein
MGTPKKASSPTSRNLDPDSNVTEESDLHSQEHQIPKTSTDAGRMISIKPVRENASSPIRDNFDPDSNATEESNPQSKKHFTPKTSTDAGRMISIDPA